MHITASVFINDDEPGLHQDYADWLEGPAPSDASPQRHRHNRTAGFSHSLAYQRSSARV